MTKLVLAVALAASLTACEKAKSSAPKASGALSPTESDLLARLPAGANVVFGGNVFDVQRRLAGSALGRMQAETNPPELTAWNECLGKKPVTMVGTGAFRDDGITMHLYFRGLSLDEMATCGRTAGLPVAVDADGKFITVDMPGRGVTAKMPYLAASDGVYGVVRMAGLAGLASGAAPTIAETTRADLEAHVASLAKGTAASDPALTALLAKIDRTQMIWFAGSAAGTPLADKLVLAYGSLSFGDGVSADVTVQPANPRDADRAIAEFGKARSQLNSVPAGMGAIKEAISAIRISKVADGVRISFKITDRQIQAILDIAGPALGR